MSNKYTEPWAFDIYDKSRIGEKSTISIVTRNSCHATTGVVCTLECDKVEEATPTANMFIASREMLEALQIFTSSFYKSEMKFGTQQIAYDKAVAAVIKATTKY